VTAGIPEVSEGASLVDDISVPGELVECVGELRSLNAGLFLAPIS
jgi:hypothetical protein